MPKGVFQVPVPTNETVRSYAVGTADRDNLLKQYRAMYNQAPIDVPMYIGSELVRTSDKRTMSPPHDHKKVLGHFNWGTKAHVTQAIDAALAAKGKWQQPCSRKVKMLFRPKSMPLAN